MNESSFGPPGGPEEHFLRTASVEQGPGPKRRAVGCQGVWKNAPSRRGGPREAPNKLSFGPPGGPEEQFLRTGWSNGGPKRRAIGRQGVWRHTAPRTGSSQRGVQKASGWPPEGLEEHFLRTGLVQKVGELATKGCWRNTSFGTGLAQRGPLAASGPRGSTSPPWKPCGRPRTPRLTYPQTK